MSEGEARGRRRPIVLIVDDSPDSRSMYAEFLSFEGFDVLEADNGGEAIATARRESPDVVVMDVGLPAIDGIEATKILRADPVTKDLLILALSGHGREVEKRALDAGANRYVRKPCVPNDLVEHLRALLVSRNAR